MDKDLKRFEGKEGWNLRHDEEIDESIPDVEVEADVPGLKEGQTEFSSEDVSMDFHDKIATIHNARYDNDSYTDFLDEF